MKILEVIELSRYPRKFCQACARDKRESWIKQAKFEVDAEYYVLLNLFKGKGLKGFSIWIKLCNDCLEELKMLCKVKK